MQDSTCDECGDPYPQTTHNRRYCSRTCGKRADKHRELERLRARALTCEQCGDEYTGSTSPEPKYCSDECLAEGHRWSHLEIDRTPVEYANCETCGRVFIARLRRTYCSEECAEDPRPWVMGWCPACEAPHVSRQPNSTYCSRDCLKRQVRTTPAFRKARARSKARRRAIKHGVDADRFDPTEIHERDNWTCQICGKKTRPDWNYLHPLAPTIDHIIPLAKGGSHTKKNCQTAHRRCNTEKSDGAANDQLRLVG